MITVADLDAAIAECQGERNPNANTCIKLAAFYTIKKEMYSEKQSQDEHVTLPSYSYATAPIPETQLRYSGQDMVGEYGDSEFLQAIKNKNSADTWAVVDELMDTLMMVNRRVYDGVMRKIDALN